MLQAAVPTEVPNLHVVPGNNDLVGFETEYMTDRNRTFRLRDAITSMQGEQASRPTEKPFSYILIDCPPSLNLLTLNALVAANAVIVPVQCEFFALEGISQLNDSIQQIRGSLNPGLEIQGVVLTMHASVCRAKWLQRSAASLAIRSTTLPSQEMFALPKRPPSVNRSFFTIMIVREAKHTLPWPLK